MSKVYRCIDCGKEYQLDYSEVIQRNEATSNEQYQKTINDYHKVLNFPSESNICKDCLLSIKINDPSLIRKKDKNKKNDLSLSKQYINEFKDKYLKDQENLKKYTEEEEQKQLKELEDIKNNVDSNEANLNILLKELENVEENETKFCNEFRDLELKLYFIEKDLSNSNNLKLDYDNKIMKLNSNNIFSELFQISFGDKYGVINGCKFCDPNVNNNYDGINGGWGYIVLLTKLLSIKFMFESSKYDLIPEGNFSKIYDKKSNIGYEIGISDMNRTKEKFNNAMNLYLDYLNEFLTFLLNEKKIENANDDVCPKIKNNKINDKSIEIGSGKEKLEEWYQCMKYLLTILKYLVCQVLIQENKSYKETINNIDNTNNNLNNNSNNK